jgi:hypothetical protein
MKKTTKKKINNPRQNQAANLLLRRGFIISVLDELAMEKRTKWTAALLSRYNRAVRLLQP